MAPTAVTSQGQGIQQQQQQYMYQAVPGIMMPGAAQYQQPYPIVYATPQAVTPSTTHMASIVASNTGPINGSANTRSTPALAPGLVTSVVYPIQPVAVVLPVPASQSTSTAVALVEAEEVKEEAAEEIIRSHSAFNIPNQHKRAYNNKHDNSNNNTNTDNYDVIVDPTPPITTTTRGKQHRRHKKHNKVPSVIVSPSPSSSSGAGHVTTDLNAPNEPNLSSSSTTTDSSLPSHSHGPVTTNTNAAMPTTEYRTHSSPLPTIPHTSTTTFGAAPHPDSSSPGDINLL